MKCQHCYCNYDESERECPMCGTRNAHVCKDDDHKMISFEREHTPRPSRPPRPAGAPRPAGGTARKQKTKPVLNQSSSEAAEATQRRNRRRVVLVFVAFFVLVQVVPALFMMAGKAVDSILSELKGGFSSMEQTYPEEAPDFGNSLDNEWGQHKTYQRSDGRVSIETQDERFWMEIEGRGSFEGNFYYGYNDPEEDDTFYTEEFPPEEFESYLFLLDYEGSAEDGDFIVVYRSRNNPDCFWFENWYADVNWLPLDGPAMFLLQ